MKSYANFIALLLFMIAAIPILAKSFFPDRKDKAVLIIIVLICALLPFAFFLLVTGLLKVVQNLSNEKYILPILQVSQVSIVR